MQLEVCAQKKLGAFSLEMSFELTGNRNGIFGPSGSGKSTLMNLLSGLVTPDSGRISLNGAPLFDSSMGINLPPEQRRVGVVFQHAHLFPHMSVQKNLFYGRQRTPVDQRKISPDLLIDVLNLSPLMGRRVTRLSGGERQRVALGRALLACPRLMLMDESLNGMDRQLKHQIIPYINKVLTEFHVPFLFISHNLDEIQLMTDHVLVVSEGNISESISSENLARQYMSSANRGYANILTLLNPVTAGDLWRYGWGDDELVLTEPGREEENTVVLSAKDITLFKRHPEASSARNLLPCRVMSVFGSGNRIGVELTCKGGRLISQVVPDAVRELCIKKGTELVAAIKASAFRRLY